MTAGGATEAKEKATTNGKVAVIAPDFAIRKLKMETFFSEMLLVSEEPGLLTSRMDPEFLTNPPTSAAMKKAEWKGLAFERSRYLQDGKDMFPGAAVKKALTVAAERFYGIDRHTASGLLRIPVEFLPLEGFGEAPEIHTATAVNWNKRRAAIVVHRAHYPTWQLRVPVIFWEQPDFKVADVVNLFNIVGHAIGLGAWRIDRPGPFGGFHVESYTSQVPYIRYAKAREVKREAKA